MRELSPHMHSNGTYNMANITPYQKFHKYLYFLCKSTISGFIRFLLNSLQRSISHIIRQINWDCAGFIRFFLCINASQRLFPLRLHLHEELNLFTETFGKR